MAFITNTLITWKDFADTCYNAMVGVCCNIDSYAANVPTRLRAGQGQVQVYSITTNIPGSQSTQTNRWYANPNQNNLISVVSSNTVKNEWAQFLYDAGVRSSNNFATPDTSHTNKVMDGKEIGLMVGLYMQFLAYHVKPVYSRRQIYNTIETNPGIFQGSQYLDNAKLGSGVTPKYTLSPIDPSTFPSITDADITNIVNQNFTANHLFASYNNPRWSTYTLS